MKKRILIYSIIALCLSVFTVPASAQVSSLYYMKTVPLRHEFNPAFQPLSNVYVDLIATPSLYMSVGNNSLTFSDVVYPKNIDGKMQTITFLHPEGNIDDFYNALKNKTRIHAEFDINILSFGFRVKKSYYTLGIAEKFNAGAFVPKDFFRLGLYGTPDTINVNSFDFKDLSVKSSLYTEIALGYSQEVSRRLTVGGKVKFLLGQANVSLTSDNFKLNTTRDKWEMDIDADLNMSLPFSEYTLDEENKIDDIDFNDNIKGKDISDLFLSKPPGVGLAFDLGATYKLLNDRLMISASIVDLGFIRWKNNVANVPVHGSFDFEGIELEYEDGTIKWDEDFFDNMLDSINYTTSFDPYTTGLSTKVFIGAEYSILNEKITFGLLSKSTIINKSIFQEITASANFLPVRWFNGTLSYSFMNGRFSNLGVGLGGRVGPFNMFIAGDYYPFRYASGGVPHKTKTFNLQMGMVLAFGNKERLQ